MNKLKLALLKLFIGNPEKLIAAIVEQGENYLEENTDDWAAYIVSLHGAEYETPELITAYKGLLEAFIAVIKTYKNIKLPVLTEMLNKKLKG